MNVYPKLYGYCIHQLGCGAVFDYIGVPYTGGDAYGAGIQKTG